MADLAPTKYVRLPGSGLQRKGYSFISATRTNCRLWLGDDHLLQVESVGGYSESYKRFYFKDIQALCLHKTKAWLISNIALGICTGLFVLFMLSTKDEGGVIALGIIAGIFGFFLLLSLGRGPSGRCYLKTAVHLEELPSLRRRRNAKKVFARIKPLIEASQGSAVTETLAPQYQALLAGSRATPAVHGQFASPRDPSLAVYRSRAHHILFVTLLVASGLDVLNIFFPGVAIVLLEMIAGGVLAGGVLVALVKQQKTDLKPAVRWLTWCVTGFVALGYVTGYALMFSVSLGHQTDGTQWGYVKSIAALQPLETPWWLTTLCISAGAGCLLGATGLLLLWQNRRETETGR